MNLFQKRITLRVLIIHGVIIAGMVLFSVISKCFKPKPKEIITFIEFPAASEPVHFQEEPAMSEPEPVATEPEPVIEPLPGPIPEPVKLKPKPKPKLKPTPKPKPKRKLVKAKDIKIGKRVNETPKKSPVSASEINKALKGITSSSSSVGEPNRFGYYYRQVMNKLHAVWVPPGAGISIARPAEVSFILRKNGAVTSRKLSVSSGNSVFDQSVMKAANRVTILPKPPSDYNFNYVIVPFDLPE